MRNLLLAILFTLLSAGIVSAQSPYQQLQDDIDSVIRNLPRGTKTSILIVDPLTLDTLYVRDAHRPYIPASNTKLFTSSAALYLLGPDYKLTTDLLADAQPTPAGIIDGNLYLRGRGNSMFYFSDISAICDTLDSLGITAVTGNIVGDDSFFDAVYSREDWTVNEQTRYSLPPVSALVLNRNSEPYENRYGRRRWRSMVNPPLEIASVLRDSLISRGITVGGGAAEGVTPGYATFITERFVELKELMKRVNKNSDNFRAECLFKTVGAVTTGNQGSAFNAAQSVHLFLKQYDIYLEGTKLVDGSGLSRYNQISTAQIVKLLEALYMDLDLFDYYYESLSIAGVDGTLEDRMQGTAAEDNFRGKTGTLRGACSVSGYVKTRDGADLIVSILFEFNRKGANYYRDVQDELINMLAQFRYPDDF